MQPLLPLIERLSLFPAETLLAVPARAEDTLRGVLVLRGLAGQLGQEAVALRREQARLAAATAGAGGRSAAACRGAGGAAGRGRGARPADRRGRDGTPAGGRRGRGGGAARRSEAARAETLRGVLAELDAAASIGAARAQEAVALTQQRRGARRPRGRPARRRHDRQFGAAAWPAHRAGGGHASSAPGATPRRAARRPASPIGRRRRARVVAACTGSRGVRFAPFRSYGLLLIVDCGGGYHAVLAGFERLDVKVGQAVAAGEPVGVMPSWEPGASGNRPALYVELRRDGQPVNPAPWLKASG